MNDIGTVFCVFVGSLILLIWSINSYVTQLEEYRQLKGTGRSTKGTIVGRKFFPPDRDFSSGYDITYEFTYMNSRYKKTVGVSKSTGDSLKEGDSVTITYVPGNPDISSLEVSEPSLIGSIILAVVVIFTAVLLLIKAVNGK